MVTTSTSSSNSGVGRKQPQRASDLVHGTLSPARLTRVCRWVVDVERSRGQREGHEKITDSRASSTFRGAGETLAVAAALTHRQFAARASSMHVPTARGATTTTTIMQGCLEFLPPSHVLITGGNRVEGSHEAKAPSSVRGRGADLLSSAHANARPAASGVVGRRAQTVRAKPGEVKREATEGN
ncbi:unnamed protein product [Lampetra planeri]